MNLLLKEFKKFSKQNWWVFVIFFICLFIISYTHKWNPKYIFVFFLIYFFAELLVITMVELIEEKKYKLSSVFQFASQIIFTSLFIYDYLIWWELYYVLFSVTFRMSAFKNLFKFNLDKDIKYINWVTTFMVWVIFFVVWYIYKIFELNIQIVLQSIWFIFFPTSLLINPKHEKLKYFLWLLWILWFVFGSAYWLYKEFVAWEVLAITICFTLMPASVLVVYLKNLKKYL